MDKEEITQDDLWELIESYFKEDYLHTLVRHQIESYNHFMTHQIIKTIEMFNPIRVVSEKDYDAVSGHYSLELSLSFENFRIHQPQINENNGAVKPMFPSEARLRNFTYASMTTVDLNIQYIIRNGPCLDNVQTMHKILPKIQLGKLPVMVGSDICILKQYKHLNCRQTGESACDTGGYFIINGSEKTVLGQERMAENRICCYNISKTHPKYAYMAEIKSVPEFKCISPKQIAMFIASKNAGYGHSILVNIPRIKKPIPLFIVFRAKGVLSDKAICEMILLDISDKYYSNILSNLQASVIDANQCMTQESAFNYIMAQSMYTSTPNIDKEQGMINKRKFTNDILTQDLFPHCQSQVQRIYFLGLMAHKLLCVKFELIQPDDRDSYKIKRVDLVGVSLNNLFRNYINKVIKDMEKQFIREIENGKWKVTNDYDNIINQTNIHKIIKPSTIDNGIKRALSTGDFGIKHVNSNKVGVGQVLNRLNHIATLSHLRRVSAPITKSGKVIMQRKLHGSSWGFICPAETPEGPSVGVIKNISCMAHVTIQIDGSSIYDHIAPYFTKIESIDIANIKELASTVKVIVNGSWIGITYCPLDLYNTMHRKKIEGIINIYTSVIFDTTNLEIRICCDGGRFTRPVLRTNINNKPILTIDIVRQIQSGKLKWNDLLTNCKLDESIIEYIDPEEQEYSLIASDIRNMDSQCKTKYTHSEIHPSAMLGIAASCIPFPECNQSPRNTYQSAMGKQAMGVAISEDRMDKTSYELTYPCRPLVTTKIMNVTGLNKVPSGCNITVAIASHTGYNQEDSVLLNQGSINRGLFQITLLHTEKDKDNQKTNGEEEMRCIPISEKTKGMKFANYGKIQENGLMKVNEHVSNRDIIISKVVPIKENKNDETKTIKFEDQSSIYHTTEDTYIDKNYTNRNGDGYTFTKVKLRTLRQPVIGDKFSSRHGQKGTAGNIIPEEDMPFTRDGNKPDIIINPHAIPSRMTIAHLKETLMGKVLVELGLFGDGTCCGIMPVNYIREQLLKLGYEASGEEVMYNGLTGEQIECNIFMGPLYYQRLKHMVYDKQHSRSIGLMSNLTRQPGEGRCRNGGLKFGEMERDCVISHGISRTTYDRFYWSSDKYKTTVCNKCGLIIAYNDKMGIYLCKTCGNRSAFSHIKIPYSCKLLFQELMTMNIVPRIITESTV